MTNRLPTLVAATLFAVSVVPFANVASAMPRTDALAIKNAVPTNIETVQGRARGWHGGGWRGRGWYGGGRRYWGGPGWGLGAGLLGGAIIGGMLAAPYYYGPGPYYYGPGYYPYAGPVYGPARQCWVATDKDRGYGYWRPC